MTVFFLPSAFGLQFDLNLKTSIHQWQREKDSAREAEKKKKFYKAKYKIISCRFEIWAKDSPERLWLSLDLGQSGNRGIGGTYRWLRASMARIILILNWKVQFCGPFLCAMVYTRNTSEGATSQYFISLKCTFQGTSCCLKCRVDHRLSIYS